MNTLNLIFAYLIDLIVGDPPHFPHPVILIGKLINKLDKLLYKKEKSNGYKFLAGLLLVLIVLGITYFSTWFLLYLIGLIHPLLAWLLSIWLISTTIAHKGLKEAGGKIKKLLEEKKIKEARTEVGYIVGRDTQNLNDSEIIRATIETISENIVDGITSPLFYAFLGGAPLAMTYRAVNTLDSMLGYKNDKYFYFGKTAARVDDLFNYIPARLTAIFIVAAAYLLPETAGKDAWQVVKRDAKKHPSPNSGFSESAVSGALKIRLGGLNYYQGQPSFRPYLGNNLEPLTTDKIDQTIELMGASALGFVVIFTMLKLLLRG